MKNRILKKAKFFNALAFFLTIVFTFYSGGYCFALAAGESSGLSINARNGAILIDSLTGDVLYEKNADKVAPVASTTKIVSTMVVLEHCKSLDEPFVVDSKAIQVEGTSMGLKTGDVVTMRDLCYGMMLASGNDAANAAAVKVAGSIEGFVKLMNEKVEKLGLKNTCFKTPSGLDEVCGAPRKGRGLLKKEDILKMPHSTAREMAILTREAMKNPVFKTICATRKAKLNFGNPPSRHIIYNHNRLLNNKLIGAFDGVCCGVKTGFTGNAGRCLVSAAQKNGVELIAVVLNDSDDWNDSADLLKFGFSKFKEVELPDKFSEVKPVVLNEKEDVLEVGVDEPARVYLTNSMKKQLKTKIKADTFLFAPILKGERIGEVEYYVNDKFLCKANLVSKSDVAM